MEKLPHVVTPTLLRAAGVMVRDRYPEFLKKKIKRKNYARLSYLLLLHNPPLHTLSKSVE